MFSFHIYMVEHHSSLKLIGNDMIGLIGN